MLLLNCRKRGQTATAPGSGHPRRSLLLFDCRKRGQAVTEPGSGHPGRSQLRRKSNTAPGPVLNRDTLEIVAATTQRQPNALRKEAHKEPAASGTGQAVAAIIGLAAIGLAAVGLAAVGPNGRKKEKTRITPDNFLGREK